MSLSSWAPASCPLILESQTSFTHLYRGDECYFGHHGGYHRGYFRPLFLPSPSQAVPRWLKCWIVFAVSQCLSGTTTEPWHLSQGREDAPMPLPTFLRYGEGKISSACHWHQFLLLLLSLSRRSHISPDCSAALLHPPPIPALDSCS